MFKFLRARKDVGKPRIETPLLNHEELYAALKDKPLDELLPLVERWAQERQRMHGDALRDQPVNQRWTDQPRQRRNYEQMLLCFNEMGADRLLIPEYAHDVRTARQDILDQAYLPHQINLPMLHALVDNGDWVEKPNDPRWDAIIDTLLQNGVSIDGLATRKNVGFSAVAYALFFKPSLDVRLAPIVNLLVNRGADLNIGCFKWNWPYNSDSPLQEAVAGYQNDSWNLEVVQQMLALGANPNTVTSKGQTSLHLAVANTSPDLFMPLLEAGTDPFVRDDEGLTALDLAASLVHTTEMDKANPRPLQDEGAQWRADKKHDGACASLKKLQMAIAHTQRQPLLDVLDSVPMDEPAVKAPLRRRL